MVTGEDFERLSWHDNFIYGIHTGFTQTLGGNPLISDQQQLPISDRAGLNLAELARELARDDDEGHNDNGAKTF